MMPEPVPLGSMRTQKMPYSLTNLSQRIKDAHGKAATAFRAGLQHAKRAGELLIQAKQQLQHGDLGDWIEANCKLTWRTANLYMQIAKGWTELQEKMKSQPIANLT